MTLAAAGAETTTAFLELGVDLLVLAALAWLAGRLRISPIPLYLLAGLLASVGGPLRTRLRRKGVRDVGQNVVEIGVLGLDENLELRKHFRPESPLLEVL